MQANTIRPKIRCQRYGRVYPDRVRVFKDPYAYPSWQVYLGTIWVGSAHSEIVAQDAAKLASLHASIIAYRASRTEAQNLIQAVVVSMATMGHSTHWQPGGAHIDHKGIIHELTGWELATDGRDRWQN